VARILSVSASFVTTFWATQISKYFLSSVSLFYLNYKQTKNQKKNNQIKTNKNKNNKQKKAIL
jgi:hypothetical protein